MADPYGDYRDLVDVGLLADVIQVFEAHGIGWTDKSPQRYSHALMALVDFADAMAKPEAVDARRGSPPSTLPATAGVVETWGSARVSHLGNLEAGHRG